MTVQARRLENDRAAQFEAVLGNFDARRYTTAPLRIYGEMEFHAPVETTFHKMTDPQTIASWFGMVKGGSVDHSRSCNLGDWGAGSKRYCDTRMGKLDETIHVWEASYLTAYNVKAWSMPVKDHLGVLTLRPLGDERSWVTWSQYFNYKGVVMRNIFPFMMRKMMNDGMAALAKELGGPGGKMRFV